MDISCKGSTEIGKGWIFPVGFMFMFGKLTDCLLWNKTGVRSFQASPCK
jgi:hypothetical protein